MDVTKFGSHTVSADLQPTLKESGKNVQQTLEGQGQKIDQKVTDVHTELTTGLDRLDHGMQTLDQIKDQLVPETTAPTTTTTFPDYPKVSRS